MSAERLDSPSFGEHYAEPRINIPNFAFGTDEQHTWNQFKWPLVALPVMADLTNLFTSAMDRKWMNYPTTTNDLFLNALQWRHERITLHVPPIKGLQDAVDRAK
jgi:hypothetical protein